MMFKLSPEAQKRVDECREWQQTKQIEFANMSDETLLSTAKFYMAQMEPRHFAPGEPVYDATMWHVILPELMRRVRNA